MLYICCACVGLDNKLENMYGTCTKIRISNLLTTFYVVIPILDIAYTVHRAHITFYSPTCAPFSCLLTDILIVTLGDELNGAF